jgi:transposase
METNRRFREYEPGQMLLLPPDMREWLPEGHLANFVSDVVDGLDLKEIVESYESPEGGAPAYHPVMLVKLLVYGYCVGVRSSRKLERATQESVAFRVLAADQHPDHDTIAEFRRRRLGFLQGLFSQVLELCKAAGLVKLGHVALDGVKVRANASKHKAMSYGRMRQEEKRLKAEVERIFAEAERIDQEEDAKYGKGVRGDELPTELARRESRLIKIREAQAALEIEARRKAEAKRGEYEKKKQAWEGRNRKGRGPKEPSEKVDPKAQMNFTDPESRIMPEPGGKHFEQSYNCQAAVDGKAQVIVACDVTQDVQDRKQLKPMVKEMKANGCKPKRLLTDASYFDSKQIKDKGLASIDLYVAVGKEKHGYRAPSAPRGRIPKKATTAQRMARKLQTQRGRTAYAKRKAIVEPVFGQIKELRGFRRFSFRGHRKVQAEWSLVCTTHNLLKLFRSGWSPAGA